MIGFPFGVWRIQNWLCSFILRICSCVFNGIPGIGFALSNFYERLWPDEMLGDEIVAQASQTMIDQRISVDGLIRRQSVDMNALKLLWERVIEALSGPQYRWSFPTTGGLH